MKCIFFAIIVRKMALKSNFPIFFCSFQKMARERKARKSNVAAVTSPATPEKIESPVVNGHSHINGSLRNGKKLSESEKEANKPLGDREKEPAT